MMAALSTTAGRSAPLWYVFVHVLLLIVVGGDRIAAQTDEPPGPVASSVSRTATALPSTTEDSELIEGDVSPLVYLPFTFHLPALPDFAQHVVDLTNEERLEAGCAPLNVSLQLVTAAQGHSEDMASNDFFSHTGSDGSLPWDRMEAAGYEWREAGENIAAGYSTPESVVAGWMASDGHRANILRCSYQDIGVGYVYLEDDTGAVNYHHYWTQVFGRPR